MKPAKTFLAIAAIIVAATIGEGIFALPYTFYSAGWLLCVFYLAILAAVVTGAHIIYLETLDHVGGKKRLLGLSQKYLGSKGFWTGIFAVILGLLLGLVAYLLLGVRFLSLAFPSLPPDVALLLFWLCVSLPVFFTDRRAARLEVAGVILTALIVLFVFFNALSHATLVLGAPANPTQAFLPFGIILLSLAGWTGIEPAYETSKGMSKRKRIVGIALGTIIAASLYLLFVAGIFGSAARITSDTVSGIVTWAAWKRFLVATLGIIAIATSYLPISRELKNSFEKDLRWDPMLSRSIIVFLPLLLIALGLDNFFAIVGIVGGIFVSLEYLLIVSVGRRALKLSSLQKLLLDAMAVVFIAFAIYEVFFSVVR